MTASSDLPSAQQLVDLAHKAGLAILEIYKTDFEVMGKADDSPLTQADLAAHKVLVAGLAELTPDIPVLSEEEKAPEFSVRQSWDRYWIIDPLDGTKEFVNRNGEFTVNVALIEGHQAVLGVVGVPVQDRIFFGDVKASVAELYAGGEKTTLSGRDAAQQIAQHKSVTAVASRSHGGERLEAYLDAVAAEFGGADRKPMGSSLKLCTLAEGEADLYPRLGPTSEWDIAAADAVLAAAGGIVVTFDGNPLRYNTKDSLLNPEFLALGDKSFDWMSRLPEYQPPE